MFVGPLFGLINSVFGYIYLFVISIYLTLVFVESLKTAVKDKNILEIPFVGFGIFLTHVVYGFNFMIGFIKKPRLKLRGVDLKTGNYLGG